MQDAAAQARAASRTRPAAAPAADHQQADDHLRRRAAARRRGRPRPISHADQGRRCCGAYGQQGDVAGALEGDRQLALVPGAGAGLAARLDLGALGQVAAEAVDLLVVDLDGLVGAERADLAAAAVAVEVVALLGADGGGMRFGSPGGQKGRSSRSVSSAGGRAAAAAGAAAAAPRQRRPATGAPAEAAAVVVAAARARG